MVNGLFYPQSRYLLTILSPDCACEQDQRAKSLHTKHDCGCWLENSSLSRERNQIYMILNLVPPYTARIIDLSEGK